MIDTPYSEKWKERKPSVKSVMLQTINTMLTAYLKPENLEEALISREDITVQAEEEEVLKELTYLPKARSAKIRRSDPDAAGANDEDAARLRNGRV